MISIQVVPFLAFVFVTKLRRELLQGLFFVEQFLDEPKPKQS